MELHHLLTIEDPGVQADEAVEAMRLAEKYLCQARAVRDLAIFKMSERGDKPFDIAKRLDLSKSQVVSVIRTGRLDPTALEDKASACLTPVRKVS